MKPWRTVEEVGTPDGLLALRQRGDRDFLLTIDGRVLMSTAHRRSEEALARLALERIRDRPQPRVLTAGLGLGFTLRALLDAAPRGARVEVAELHDVVARWCAGPLAAVNGAALRDGRVSVRRSDVMRTIAGAQPGAFDAIVLDLMEGPSPSRARAQAALYGPAACADVRRVIAPGGVYTVWGEDDDPEFLERLLRSGFDARRVVVTEGGPRHVVYVAQPMRGRGPRGMPLPDGREAEAARDLPRGRPRDRRR